MAITDNIFTADEFQAALTASPDLLNIVKGKIFENPEWLKTIEGDIISPKKREWAERDEAETFALTGIHKKDKEPFHDYRKRAFAEALEAKETELANLRNKHNPSAADQARIKQLEEANANLVKEKNQLSADFDSKLGNMTKQTALTAALAELRKGYKKDLPESLVALAEKDAIQQLTEAGMIQTDGTLTFKDGQGNVRQNTSTYKPLTAAEVLGESLKDLIDPGTKAAGAGGTGKGDEGKQGEGAAGGKFAGVPAHVKTKTALNEHLAELGYTKDSKEFNEIWRAHASALPLDDIAARQATQR